MQLTVHGKQLDIGDALRVHVRSELDSLLGKYFGDAIEAQVTLSREAHLYRALVTVHVGKQIQLEARGEANDPYVAFDVASERLGKRLRRHKRRLRDHHKEPEGEALPAQQYILAGEGDEGEAVGGGGVDGQPATIAEMTTEIPTLSVSEAVMRLDLGDLQAMLFRNAAHGELNMIYRRADGNIGWVDPRSARQS